MIIRATSKLLKSSAIKAIKNTNEIEGTLPGEWYATLISGGRPGKMVLHFMHNPTMLSVVVPGKSLNKAVDIFRERVQRLLLRAGYEKLLFSFQLKSEAEIYTTNSRSIVSHLTQKMYTLEAQIADNSNWNNIDWNAIEDYHLDYLFSRNGDYTTSNDLLQELM